MIVTNSTYKQHNPRESQYYKCVEAHYEELGNKWEDNYQHNFGYWRYHITDVIYKYLVVETFIVVLLV